MSYGVKDEITRDIRKSFELNENKSTTIKIYALKKSNARGKFEALNVYIRKE